MDRPPIVLMSDFGHEDGYVAAMKGVILSRDAALTILDGPQAIRAHSVQSAAYVLFTVVHAFPTGTIFTCVVDPGVGSDRQELIANLDNRIVVCPDNGLVSLAAAFSKDASYFRSSPNIREWIQSNNQYRAATFDGRDLFSPLAAELALRGLEAVCQPLSDEPVLLRELRPVPIGPDAEAHGTVIHVDVFGNVVTNLYIDSNLSQTHGDLLIDGSSYALQTTFTDAEVGSPVCYRGSYGFVELAIREGRAAEDLSIPMGAPATFRAQSGHS